MIKMIDLITLNVVNQIFNSCEKVKPLSKLLYINCLTKKFKELDATAENATSFEFLKNEIPKYNIWQTNFMDLQIAGLVTVTHDAVVFNNTWGQLIDRSKFGGIQVGISTMNSALKFEQELMNNTSMLDVIGMKNKLNKNQVLSLIKIFVLEQDATQSMYRDLGDCSKHFIYWVNTNKDKIEIVQDTAKSKSKILGLDEK
jgi:hypothetical protein